MHGSRWHGWQYQTRSFPRAGACRHLRNFGGAAAHAILAVAIERGWRYGSHRDFVVTVRRLTEESGDETVSECFDEARRFHANFYQNFMEDADIERLRPRVHEFVPTVLDLLDISPDD